MTYNASGQLASISEPYLSSASPQIYKTYAYDSYGRVITEATPLGNITYTYSGTSTGAKTTVTDRTTGDSFTSTRTYDLSGKLKSITESGGETITYTYGPTGNPSKVQSGSAIFEMKYDLLGRQKELKDPNAGTITFNYNNWGELKSKTDARGQTETFNYHSDGRINTYIRDGQTFTYGYYTDLTVPKETVKSISASSGMNTLHVYDGFGRLKKTTETIETGKSLTLEYDYDNKGQLNKVTYPNNRTLQYEYAYGDLKKMTWMSNTVVWEKLTDNAKGQPTSVRHGNGIETAFQYTNAGVPTSIIAKKGATTMMNISYPSAQIDTRGNIKLRNDILKGQSETFSYDNLNRLSTGVSGVTYASNGNIQTKTGVGTYAYESSRPHTVTGITDATTGLFTNELFVSYNNTGLPVELKYDNTHKYNITYGTQNQRVKSVYIKLGAITQTKYYMGPYEEVIKGSTIQKKYYIYAGDEIVAAYTEGGSDPSAGLYYFHNDHLGSPWLITNST